MSDMGAAQTGVKKSRPYCSACAALLAPMHHQLSLGSRGVKNLAWPGSSTAKYCMAVQWEESVHNAQKHPESISC